MPLRLPVHPTCPPPLPRFPRWAVAATASLAAYSYLVSRNAMDAAPLVEGLNTEDLSPQLEVVVALLITMTCEPRAPVQPTWAGGRECLCCWGSSGACMHDACIHDDA